MRRPTFRGLSLRSPAFFAAAGLFLIVSWTLFASVHFREPSTLGDKEFERRFPLAWRHIQTFHGKQGAWYIPPEWIGDDEDPPSNILDAVRLASRVAMADPAKQIRFSNVPLLVHQTWIRAKLDTLNLDVVSYVEQWLAYATSSQHGPMAYFLWDNDGLAALFREYEPDFYNQSLSLFSPVEQTDIFRILVCKLFVRRYGYRASPAAVDVDSPIRHRPMDRRPNRQDVRLPLPSKAHPDADPQQDRPVNLVLGLEADTDPASDSYWRMGYEYPVQLTQWALASAPKHPVLSRFMDDLTAQVRAVKEKVQRQSPANYPAALRAQMSRLDPLTLTGPAAITLSTMSWLKDELDFRWEAVTGLTDGGRAKLVSDVLVLPITAFSPGRGKYGNMGSKPIGDPDARLAHSAQGSWRRFDLKVELGKFCRTVFGLCRDWSKVPG
ncbi:bfaaa25d-f384-4e21-8b0e-fdbcbf3cbd81 [Thermothielavioides terrestris]|uniref:Bfaaa25d-f384-4e21-8b0e-fdbcbf3cbd81 n=1 Tax=Thermothielavioides terrestris TaxID=2587410 RepID=A0A446BVJ2_9PEZI|nr:bfaaa25d-f384-4e21-8b0e-fdbcbf3cbd81 [Thermothielavioides terrestris]